MAETFANIKRVYPSGQRVQTNNDVHAVFLHWAFGDRLQILLLVAVGKLRAWDVDPRSVIRWDPESIDIDSSNLVNVCCCDEGCVPLLKKWTTLCTKSFAPSPFVCRLWGIGVPPDWIVFMFLLQPRDKIDPVCLVYSPVNEVDFLWPVQAM